MIWVMAGLVIFVIALMVAIRIYKNIREKNPVNLFSFA